MKNFFVIICATLLIAGCGNDYKHLTHEDAQRIIKSNPDAIILDVRTPEEYDKKHIANAVLVPVEDLIKGDFSKLPDKNAPILIYCWTGRRAEDSAKILIENGYTNVYEFGGLIDWEGSISGKDLK